MAFGISRSQLVTVVVLLAGTFVAVLNATLLTPALPTIMRDMQVDSTTAQWLTSGYALTEAVVIPLAAYLMGRIPTRPLYIGGIALFGIGSVVAALSPAFPVLLLGRIIQAAATGAVMPMVMSVVLLTFPREHRGSAMGIVGLLIGFAPAIGPTLSGVLVDAVGWRAIFGIVAGVSLLIVIVAAAALRNTESFRRTKFDALSVALSTVGLLCLLYGLSTFSSAENHAVTAALVVVGIVLVGLYARRQLKLEEPMLRIEILKTRNYRTVVIIVMIFQAALIGMETIMPLYIQGVLGKPATVSGVTLLPGAVIGAVTGVLAGRIFDRHGVRPPIIVGAVIIAIAALGFGTLRADSPIVLVSVVYAVMAIGMQFTMTPLNTWGVNSLPNDAIQHAQSTSNTLNQVAGSFGTALLVSIAAAVSGAATSLEGTARTFAGYHASFATTATLCVVAVVIILVFVRDRKTKPADRPASATSVPGRSAAAAMPSDASVVTVAAAMNPTAAKVPSSATMRDVIELMSRVETTGVSVVDERGSLVGYVADGDIARFLAKRDQSVASPSSNMYAFYRDSSDFRDNVRSLAATNVMELATKHVITFEADLPLDKACSVLAERKIKKAPVTRDGVLVGAQIGRAHV